MVEESAENTNTPPSLDQRGQIAHYYILLALEVYAWSRGIDPSTLSAPRLIVAGDGNSARNHAIIDRTASEIHARLAKVSPGPRK